MKSDDRHRTKFITAVIADDIRTEASGKEIYVGVYTDNMIMIAVPDAEPVIRLAASVIFEALDAGQIPVHINILGPGQSEGGTNIRGKITAAERSPPNTPASITLPPMPVAIRAGGEILIRAKNYEDDEW